MEPSRSNEQTSPNTREIPLTSAVPAISDTPVLTLDRPMLPYSKASFRSVNQVLDFGEKYLNEQTQAVANSLGWKGRIMFGVSRATTFVLGAACFSLSLAAYEGSLPYQNAYASRWWQKFGIAVGIATVTVLVSSAIKQLRGLIKVDVDKFRENGGELRDADSSDNATNEKN